MSNTLITSTPVANLAVELLVRSLVLPMSVLRVTEDNYTGSGGTVSVRVRTPRTARSQDTAGADITFDDLQEQSVDVTLSHLYNAALLADEDLTLGLTDFGRQVTEPQVSAVATGAEDKVAAQMNAVSNTWTVETADVFDTVLLAREQLTTNKVPMGRRWLACGPQFATALLGDARVSRADQSGSPSALRDAVVGKVHGFNVIETPAITNNKAIAYHESAFVFATKTPVRPRGAESSSTASVDGIGLRHLFSYVPTKLADASIVSTFAGAGTVTEDGDDPGSVQKRAIAIGLTDPVSS